MECILAHVDIAEEMKDHLMSLCGRLAVCNKQLRCLYEEESKNWGQMRLYKLALTNHFNIVLPPVETTLILFFVKDGFKTINKKVVLEDYWQTQRVASKEVRRLRNMGCTEFRVVLKIKKLYNKEVDLIFVKWTSRYCLYVSEETRTKDDAVWNSLDRCYQKLNSRPLEHTGYQQE